MCWLLGILNDPDRIKFFYLNFQFFIEKIALILWQSVHKSATLIQMFEGKLMEI